MINFIIDIFCKDTIIGLSEVNFDNSDNKNIKKKQISLNKNKAKPYHQRHTAKLPSNKFDDSNMRLYKNFYEKLFDVKRIPQKQFKDTFIDPIAYHLLTTFQNQKALYSV